ncbi:GntR family transcriptional regulator [Rhizohabitans arisaemae]|uniref:GntR family transcriptional regulator n=1 Tax=Rhizohabitans arisaemae TaxID=2720610 RepID=UPI0024B15F94|nr:GntR family transcriptional regulator [Rhizohabitans arisaemae]
MKIERRPLREQIKDELRLRLERGEFDPDETINEGLLATSLGVSRTPLREALIALEMEGLIRSEMGKGFRFAPMSAKELGELIPVLATLEAFALRLTDPEHLHRIAPALLERAKRFSVPRAEHGVIERYDDEWHDLLLSGCPNERLMELITSLKLGVHRYERLVVGDHEVLERHAEEHQQIAERLLAGDVDGAVDALHRNWASGLTVILERLG